MEDLAPQHPILVHLLGADVPVRPPEEAEAPLPSLVHGHHGHGGGLAPRAQAGGVHAVVRQHLPKVIPETVVPHLAPEGGFGPQTGRRHRDVGGRAAGVGGELGHPRRVDPCLGQVNQNLTNRCYVHDTASYLFLSYEAGTANVLFLPIARSVIDFLGLYQTIFPLSSTLLPLTENFSAAFPGPSSLPAE